ncbi:MAG: TonB-dependent receptor, partial [Saprospiraceae bacterium]
VNGKRRHQSALVNVNGTVNRGTVGTDMNAIPASAVERIEILRDGAAAQYGSDAIAGVINIVTKRKTGLLDAAASVGQYFTSYDKKFVYNKLNNIAADPSVDVQDGLTYQANANYGFKLGAKGFANLTGEYAKRGATNRTGLYTGQIYPKNGAGQVRDDSILGAKGLTRDAFDMRIGNSEVTSGGVFLNSGYNLTEDWELYLFGGYNNKQGNSAGFYRYPNGIPTASNALSIYPDGFLPNINSDVTDLAASFGIRGKIGGWSADLSQTFGKNQFDFNVSNSVNYTQANVDPTNIQREFDAGGLSFQQLTTNLDLAHQYKVLSGLNVALGGEFRSDEFDIEAGEEASYKNFNTAAGLATGAQVFAGFQPQNAGKNTRTSAAGYLDVELDLTQRFLVGAALRFENYSDFGQTLNYKAVARYKISDNFTLRASTSTGFRAPSQQQKYYAKTNTLFVNGPNGLQPVESGTFTNSSRPATIFGIPELQEETSTSYAGGIAWRPMTGLELTVDAYQIDIDNRIVLTNNFTANGNAELATQLAAAGATTANFFANAVNTRSQGLEAVLSYTTRFENNQELRCVLATTFIDNEVKKGDNGKPIVNSSEVLEATGQVGRYFNREDQSRIEVANPRAKASLTLNYKAGKLSFMLRNAYWGKVEYLDPIDFTDQSTWPKSAPYYTASTMTYNPDAFRNALTGTNEAYDQTFNPKVVTDLTVTYQLIKQLSVAFGAN